MKHAYRSTAVIALALLALTFGLFLAGCHGEEHGGGKWHCPMHPTYVSDKAGDCPICGMRLVPIEDDQSAGGTPTAQAAVDAHEHASTTSAPPPAGGERKVLFYRSPMDPSVTSPVPAKDSMGMDYVPVYAEDAAASGSSIEGYAPIEVSPDALAASGVRSEAAVEETLGRSVRTNATVIPAETEVRHIHTKISGWVEKLYINSTGQYVKRGQPILAIYSQELLATQEEYLRARSGAARFASSSLPEVQQGGQELLQAARRRLELFDVPEAFIRQLEETGKPSRTVPILAPISGFVAVKDTFEGQQIDPAMDLFTISDLSKIWIEADFYQSEVPEIRVGQPANVSSPYDPSLNYSGRVSYVYPYLNPETRTLRARFEFPNPGLKLKPQMFVDVTMEFESQRGIVIPDSSVIDTGTRQVVFVDHGSGKFEPRQVTIAARADGRARVTSGVSVGERVVTKANFLLDSESRLRAAISQSTSGKPEHQHGGGQ